MERADDVREALDSFLNEELERLTFSNPRSREHFLKLTVRPVLLRGVLKFQIEEFTEKQAFQKNLEKEEAVSYLTEQLEQLYRNGEAVSPTAALHVLISKKGAVTLKIKKKAKEAAREPAGVRPSDMKPAGVRPSDMKAAGVRPSDMKAADIKPAGFNSKNLLVHNRKKRYVLEEGVPVPFLVDLGVMTREGAVVRAKFDKFRQINRFLEFIEDVLPQLDRSSENVIVDFGCGKSYLTFAMYYYLKELKGYPIRIVGLDLKKDVIAFCNRLSEKFGFDHLYFYHGDIAGFEELSKVDMVVTLHACDTATDYALEKAIRWGAKVILSVPCCQHELNRQIDSELLRPVLKYGILKERMAALVTDGIRAELLESMGYRTQILEFIDMEHTPKNLLIRAVKQGKACSDTAALTEMMEKLQVSPTLYRLLTEYRAE